MRDTQTTVVLLSSGRSLAVEPTVVEAEFEIYLFSEPLSTLFYFSSKPLRTLCDIPFRMEKTHADVLVGITGMLDSTKFKAFRYKIHQACQTAERQLLFQNW